MVKYYYICSMSKAKINTCYHIELEFELVPFHRRLLARIIDIGILFVYLMGLVKLMARLDYDFENDPVIVLVFFLPVLFYDLFFEWFLSGSSPGKYLMKIKVVTLKGGWPDPGQYLIRWLFRSVEGISLLGMPAILCIIFTDHSQRIGDLAAGTMLIDMRTKGKFSDTLFMNLSEGYRPSFPEVMRLKDKDLNILKTYTEQYYRTGREENLLAISARIKLALAISTPLKGIDLIETLLNDYNYYTREKDDNED